jgi:DNA-directed RNA polymerase specialized sigma24 family protein
MMIEPIVFKEIRAVIFAKTLQYVINRDDTEDIIQDVLEELWKQRYKIAPEAAFS